MFYGVEQSTDLRDRRTVIKKFMSLSSLQKWTSTNSGRFTHEDPQAAKNTHHTFRYGYELNGTVNKKDPIFTNVGSRTYPQPPKTTWLSTYTNTVVRSYEYWWSFTWRRLYEFC